MHVGEQVDKTFQFLLETRCTHDIPLMYSWYPPDVLTISPRCTENPRCTEHPPMY